MTTFRKVFFSSFLPVFLLACALQAHATQSSTTTVTATPNPVAAGHTVMLHVTVTGAGGTATGSVNFEVGGNVIATVSLSSGAANLTAPTTGLAAGSYSVIADYLGNANYNASSGSVTVVISKATTSTKLTASPNPVTQPAKCVLAATVTRSGAGESGVAKGTVTFKVGSTSLGEANLNASGVATLSASSSLASAGSYPVTADYNGDSSDAASISSAVTVVVRTGPVAYAYTLNSSLNNEELGNISAYAEASTGQLSLLSGSPYNTGLIAPAAVAVDQAMGLLFAAGVSSGSQSTGEIVAFPINNSTGALGTPVTLVPSDTPSYLAVGPSGKYLYVSHHDSDSVSAYSVAANGTLTEISDSPFSLPATNCGLFCEATADELTYDPAAKTLYVVSNYGWIVATYTVDTSTGALTWIYNEPTGNGPDGVAGTPNGDYVYTSNPGGSNNVSAFQVTTNATTSGGTPEPVTQVQGSPFAAGNTPVSLAIDPTGSYLYVSNNGDNTISGYTINSTSGALTQMSNSPFSLASDYSSPQQIVVDPAGKYVYLATADSTGTTQTGGVSAFSITAGTGELVQIANSPFSPGSGANGPLQIGFYKPQ